MRAALDWRERAVEKDRASYYKKFYNTYIRRYVDVVYLEVYGFILTKALITVRETR
jgi:hypothetical protein